jgi:hypothetical protein
MDEYVLVLSDARGNLYTVTRELLSCARIGSDSHKQLVRRLVEPSKASEVIGDTLEGFKIEGAFRYSLDPDPRRGYLAPLAVIRGGPRKPPPP